MTDVFTKEKRSEVMSRVRSRDTGPERRVRSLLFRKGFRFRLHAKGMPGSPDLVFPRFNAVVFVHGCFWHAHPRCKFATRPSSRVDYWKNKFDENRRRDKRNYAALKEMGWRVFVVWECAVKSKGQVDSDALAAEFGAWLDSGVQSGEFAAASGNRRPARQEAPTTNERGGA